MLLAVDIGNTNILSGVFDGSKLIFTSRLASDKKITSDQYALLLDGISKLRGFNMKQVDGVIISSVVPELTGLIKDAIFELTGINALVLGPGVKSGLRIKIDNPAQLGADLVAGAVGAVDKYPLPCLIIDLGTATKISVLDSTGAFRGCTISAGVGISLNALSDAASLLPDIEIDIPHCVAYGTNTISSMQAGVILGNASMIDGMCDKIEEFLGEKVSSIVATGGYADNIIKYCNRHIHSEPELILHGLRVIYSKN